jgi:hypothetical protein
MASVFTAPKIYATYAEGVAQGRLTGTVRPSHGRDDRVILKISGTDF